MFSTENGFTPRTFDDVMETLRLSFSQQFGVDYSAEVFKGTNFYKFCYRVAQSILEQDILAQNIYEYYLNYVQDKNFKINTPIGSYDFLIDKFNLITIEVGFASVTQDNAGTIQMAVNLTGTEDNYVDLKDSIGNIFRDFTVAGTNFVGDETIDRNLSNGQVVTYRYELAERIPAILRCTFTISENNQAYVMTEDEVKQTILDNLTQKYRIGMDFEPQRYANATLFPFAATVLLEWSTNNGVNWSSDVNPLNYNQRFIITVDDITIVGLE